MKSCMNCEYLEFPNEPTDTVRMRCGLALWTWDFLTEDNPIFKVTGGKDCPRWAIRMKSLYKGANNG